MEYEFLILHEINLKTKVGKCQVLSVAMNKKVLGFTFTLLSYEYLWLYETWPICKRGLLIKFREREKEIKITKLKEKKTLSCHFTVWV